MASLHAPFIEKRAATPQNDLACLSDYSGGISLNAYVTSMPRDRWTILAPERVFTPDAIAVAVLQLCDGSRSVETIAGELAQTYNAPKDRILADISALLQDLADKGVVTA